MRITDSAVKRGIAPEDILHALDNYVCVFADQGDAMLEVGVIEDDDPRAIHAMPARPKYWP